MPPQIRALSGDAAFLRRLRAGCDARVHSVFARTVNVMTGDGALHALAGRDVDDAPDTLVVDVAGFAGRGLAAGDAVLCRGDRLAVGNGLAVRLDAARPWSPRLPAYPADDARLRRNIAAVRDVVVHADRAVRADHASGVFHSTQTLLQQRGEALRNALCEGDLAAAFDHGVALVGLGPGLTPSGDDVLLGVFAALHLPGSPGEDRKRCADAIVACAGKRTNAISLAALRAAAGGRVRARIEALLAALLREGTADALARLRPVLAIGATSGRDIVAGLLLGLDVQLHVGGLRRAAA